MKVLIKRFIIILVCTVIPVYMYIITPSLKTQKIELNETNVVIVNEDEGTVIDGLQYNFGSKFIESFVEQSEFNVSSENFADAYNALENGNVMYMIVIDREFSTSINSFDSLNHNNAKVTYYYNHTYDRSLEGNVQSEEERNKVFEYLQNELSIIYLKTIIEKVEDSKEMLRDDIEADIEIVEGVNEKAKENSSSLKGTIDNANQHISGFNNEMNEKVDVVEKNVETLNENDQTIVDSATSNKQHTDESVVYYETFSSGIEETYNANYTDYEAYTNLVVGEDGISSYILDDVIPIYIHYMISSIKTI